MHCLSQSPLQIVLAFSHLVLNTINVGIDVKLQVASHTFLLFESRNWLSFY